MLSNLGKGLHLKPEIKRDSEEIAKLHGIIMEKANEAVGFVNGQIQAFESHGYFKDFLHVEFFLYCIVGSDDQIH